MSREANSGARCRASSAENAAFLHERCLRTSAFGIEAARFPLKSRYSGDVRGGEGTEGYRLSVTGTPGSQALRWRERPVLGSPCHPGRSWRERPCGDGSSGASGCDDHNGTGIEGTVKGCFPNVHFQEYRTFSGQRSAPMVMPFVCPGCNTTLAVRWQHL